MDYTSDLSDHDVDELHDTAANGGVAAIDHFSKVAALAYARWEALRGGDALPSITHDQAEESRLFTPNCVQVAWNSDVSTPTISYLGNDLAARLASICGKEWPNLPIESPLVVMLHDVSLRAIVERDATEFDEPVADSEGRFRDIQGLALPFAGKEPGTFLVDVIFDLDNPFPLSAKPAQEGNGAHDPDDVLLLEQELDPDEMPRPAVGPAATPVLFVCVSDTERPPRHIPNPPLPPSMARARALLLGAGGPSGTGSFAGDANEEPLLLTEPLEPQSETEFPAVPADADRLLLSLQVARDRAAAASGSEERSHIALYKAIGAAYDFALHAAGAPERLEAIILAAGLTVQARAPMTPVVKLIFGADYDRTRLAEYASALTHAFRAGLPAGSFADYLQSFDGGLKGVVKAERDLRRKSRPDIKSRLAKVEAKLRGAPASDFGHFELQDQEFALVIARRMPDGSTAVIGEVPADERLFCSAARKFLKK